jgi:hypothetical protein
MLFKAATPLSEIVQNRLQGLRRRATRLITRHLLVSERRHGHDIKKESHSRQRHEQRGEGTAPFWHNLRMQHPLRRVRLDSFGQGRGRLAIKARP